MAADRNGRGDAVMRPSTALVVALLLASGCAGSDVDWNPFYVGRVYESEQGDSARVISAGPFWDDAKTKERRETALHPLWRRLETPDSIRIQVLDPLWESRWKNDEVQHRLLPFNYSRTHRSSSTEGEYDFMFFPLLWFGHATRPDESYFALFPLFGQIKGFAAFAEVGFFLFPLYYYARKEVSEPETIHNVTPLIRWVSGGPREESWHVLPFFGHWSWAGKYEKWTALWPLFHLQHNRLDTDDPSQLVALWPLFGVETSARMRFFTFLWPFFRFRSERAPGVDEQGQPREEVYTHQDFLWPLFRREHTREHDLVRLFPFYSRYHSREIDSQAFAIPFLWKREVREKGWTKSTFDFVPLVHWEEKEFDASAGAAPREDSAFKLWPLFQVKDEAGVHDVKFPTLLPLDTELYAGDFEANWSPLWELWHSRSYPDGATRGNALLRLADWEAREGRARFSIPLLYSYDGDRTRSSHSLLLGLVKFGGGEGGAELKLLGMPILTPEVRAR